MDYLFVMSLFLCAISMVIASYDIACQWATNFWRRMANFPEHIRLQTDIDIQFLVPKFHLPAHVPKCFAPYSFNFTRGVGRTDGEGVERNWSWLNGMARCLSMMGAGARWDTIDDLCNHHNYQKTIDLGESKCRVILDADVP